MKRPVTLIQVAAEAGVSPSTVSRILNGTARVAADKEKTVRDVIERLGYRPNTFARGLVTGVSHTIGVLTQDIASPFYNDTLRGVEDGLAGSSYSALVISGHWQSQAEGQAIELLLSRQVEALMVLGGSLPERQLLQAAEILPVVVLGRHVALRDFGGASLTLDNVEGGRLAVAHLIEQGHQSIAHIMGRPDHPDAQDRLLGYRRALEDAGLPFDERLVAQGDFREPSGLLAMQQLLQRRLYFTAIFCANDQMAYGARLELYRRGIGVPEDLSLVGFDDLPASSYTTPPLTTVRQPMHELGLQLARHLLGQLEGEEVPLTAPPLELTVRESTAVLEVLKNIDA